MPVPNPSDGVFLDLSANIKIRVSGADRERYLNGQLTADVRKAGDDASLAACILNAKGKMDAYVVVSREGDSFLIDSVPELGGALQARLERYIIADDVRIEDATAAFSLFHVIAGARPEVSGGCRVLAANRFGQPGHDIWCAAAQHDERFAEIAGGSQFADHAAGETFRIEHGIPRWGRELTGDILPPEAGLDTSCIDYDKGCYIGQEVISRMKMSGQRNKKLTGFVSLDNYPLEPGMKLFTIGDNAKEVGWITSATHSKKMGKEIALGYLKRPFFPRTFKLEARNLEDAIASTVRVEIADLPFEPAGA